MNSNGHDLIKAALDLGLLPSTDSIQVGDIYLGLKNTGPKLLTAKSVQASFIVPEEILQYPFDKCDCIKIID